MKKTKLPTKLNTENLVAKLLIIKRYTLVLFIILLAGTYGFVLYRINSLTSLQPTEESINSQVQAAKVPKIDKAVVDQLKTLQDNSVNVQTLFEQARTSPFQE